jgi:hypothetical protein
MPQGVLRVAYKVYYPFVSECARLPKLRKRDDCHMPGMMVEVWFGFGSYSNGSEILLPEGLASSCLRRSGHNYT